MEQQAVNSALTGLFMGLGLGVLLFGVAIGVFSIICHWKIFTKSGKPGWACLIPIYNVIVFLDIVNKPWWWIFLLMIPIVNIIIVIILVHRLSLSFGKGAGFTLGLIFFNLIFDAILAFDSSEYKRLEE